MLSCDPERRGIRDWESIFDRFDEACVAAKASPPFAMTRRFPLPARRSFASIDRVIGSRSGRSLRPPDSRGKVAVLQGRLCLTLLIEGVILAPVENEKSQHGPRKAAQTNPPNDRLPMGKSIPTRRCLLRLSQRSPLAGRRSLPAMWQHKGQEARYNAMELVMQRMLAFRY